MSYSFIVDPTVPFNGRNYSCINNKTNKTFSGETIEEYRISENNHNFIVVGEDEFDKKYYRPYLESYRSDWKEVSKEEFNDLYECLPPFKIGTINDVFLFCCPEATTGDMHTWGARKDGKYYMATRSVFDKLEELVEGLPCL